MSLRRTSSRVVPGLAGLLLVAGLGVATPAAADGPRQPATSHSRAEAALAHALDVMSPHASSRASEAVAGRSATLALRDLVAALPSLRGRDADLAAALLARPTDGGQDPEGDGYTAPESRRCYTHFCLHWVKRSVDAVDTSDGSGNSVPDYVDTVATAMGQVWDKEIGGLGYRAPKPDGTLGGSDKLDIYLADLGADGIYGYCVPEAKPADQFDRAAYCVLDNDFDPAQFGGRDYLDSLRATAAHEFFHAVQFAYDAFEDGWFMESTATWMEDEVYDDVDDNYQYLDSSGISWPNAPLDYFSTDARFQYGQFIFWKYLAESLGTARIVRDAWLQADAATATAPDLYSTQATAAALKARGTDLGTVFGDWSAKNMAPQAYYSEGAAYRAEVPSPPLAGTFRLSTSKKSSGLLEGSFNHLTSTDVRFVPTSTLSGTWNLRVEVDLPDKAAGSQARLLTELTDGTFGLRTVRLGTDGNATVTVPFSRARVKNVILTMANANAKFRCWQDAASPYSCLGDPLGDGKRFVFRGTAVRP